MSLLFEQSANISQSFITLAVDAGSHALFLDTEDSRTWKLLYPKQRQVPRPDFSASLDSDDCFMESDQYYIKCLVLAGVPISSRGRVP